MKTICAYLSLLVLGMFFFIGCDNAPKVTYPLYKYDISTYTSDSMQRTRAEWIKETVRAADQHLSAGDYEDVDDVIRQVNYTSEELFTKRGEGLRIIRSEEEYSPKFIPYEQLTSNEKIIFENLKAQNHGRLN